MTRPHVPVHLHAAGGRSVTLELPADPTRTYTWIPEEAARALSLERIGHCAVLSAEGRMLTRSLAQAFLEYDGERRPVTVVLGEAGDVPALGATTLDAFHLVVDPETGEIRRDTTFLYLAA